MEDVFFITLAEAVIGYVDERYGRAAAWVAALAMLVLLAALVAGLIWWLTSAAA
ncbi:MAG: hypothetical protein K2Y20_02710 [Sphingomonas sp.]|nr:hypothetical protein [Sphingomonas sp.]